MLGVHRAPGRATALDGAAVRRIAIAGYVLLAVGILVARRPDAVLHPQFWAEDGKVYFADAYNRGTDALLTPGAGYLVLIPRLTALLAQPLGLAAAPVVFNLVGLTVQLLPALFILSSRFGRLIPSLPLRALVGLMYLLLPCEELHATVTNAQWHLAVLMCMVLVAAPPRGVAWRCFDIGVLVLGGLSGPLVLVIAPLALVRRLVSGERWFGVVTITTAAVSLVQLKAIHDAGRGATQLGAGVRLLVRIVADRVIVPAVTADQSTAIYSIHWWHGLLWAALIVLATAALAALALLRGPLELKLLLVFGGLSLTLALLHPLIVPVGPQWPPIVVSGGAERYFLVPMLAVLMLLIWGIGRLPRRVAPVVGGVLAVTFLAGVAAHPQYPPLLDDHPAASAAALDAAPRGTVVDVPINPAGWSMSLRKH